MNEKYIMPDFQKPSEILVEGLAFLKFQTIKENKKDYSGVVKRLESRLSKLTSNDKLEMEFVQEELTILTNSKQDEITCFRFGKREGIQVARRLKHIGINLIDRIKAYRDFIDRTSLDGDRDSIDRFGYLSGIKHMYVWEFNKLYLSNFSLPDLKTDLGKEATV